MFIGGCEKYLVSSSVAIWYYEEGYPDKPILRSLPRLLKSTGSVALGSFLISVTIVIRLLLSFANVTPSLLSTSTTEQELKRQRILLANAASEPVSVWQIASRN